MKHTIESFPTCEKCEVYTKPELRTSTARATFCEGLRAVGNCPKDLWKAGLEKELREIMKDVEGMRHHKEYNRIYLLKELLGEDNPE